MFVSPVISPDGVLYQTVLKDTSLYAIDSNSGAKIWSLDLADPCSGWFESDDFSILEYSEGWSEPVLGPDGTLYVSLDDPYLRAVNPDGTIQWTVKLGSMGGFTMTVDQTGLIYAAGDDGRLRVIHPNGVEIAQFKTEAWLGYPVIHSCSNGR